MVASAKKKHLLDSIERLLSLIEPGLSALSAADGHDKTESQPANEFDVPGAQPGACLG
jgi:hypothetical protein